MKRFELTELQKANLTIFEKAERSLLDEKLSINEIGRLLFPDKSERYSFYEKIIEQCKNDLVTFDGKKEDLDNWNLNYASWQLRYYKKSYPNKEFSSIEELYTFLDYLEREKIEKACIDKYWETFDNNYYEFFELTTASNVLIHRDDLENFLRRVGYWPVIDCELVNWWLEANEVLLEKQNDSSMSIPIGMKGIDFKSKANKKESGYQTIKCNIDEDKNQDQNQKITRNQIKKIFNKLNCEQWRGIFSRESKSELGSANVGEKGKPIYLLILVCNFLKSKGHYSGSEIKVALNKYNDIPLKVVNNHPTKASLGEQLAAEAKRK